MHKVNVLYYRWPYLAAQMFPRGFFAVVATSSVPVALSECLQQRIA